MTPERERADAGLTEAEKYFPALRTLARIFVFGLRMTGALFGLIFTLVPIYLMGKFVFPVLIDPARPAGERWGAAAFGAFGFCFLVAGLFVLRDAVLRARWPSPRTVPPAPTLPPREEMIRRARRARRSHALGMRRLPGGEVVVSSANLYRTLAALVGVFAALWNGLVLFALFDLKGFGHAFSFIQALFMLPFLVVGIGLAYVLGKLLLSLRQPTVEFRLPKAEFRRGETVRAEIRLRDPTRLARSLEITLRKRFLRPEDEGSGLGHAPGIQEERLLIRKEREELDFEWADAIVVALPAAAPADSNEEWSEWSLEAKVETGAALPLYLAAALPYEVPEA